MRYCRSTRPNPQVPAWDSHCAGRLWRPTAVGSVWPTALMAPPAQSLRCGSLTPTRPLDVPRRLTNLADRVTTNAVSVAGLATLDLGVLVALGRDRVDRLATESLQVLTEVLA